MSKAKKSDFLKGFGKAFEIFKAIVNAVLDAGGDDSDLERTLMEADLCKQIAALIVGAKKVAVDTFRAVVTYIQPKFAELKSAFDWVNDDYQRAKFEAIKICEAISRETREVTFQYVHMNRDASTEEVLAEMDKRGLRPVLYEELLAFAKAHPDEQRKYPIVALGSVWVDPDGFRDVACLNEDGDERSLGLSWYDDDWRGFCRFLAVSK